LYVNKQHCVIRKIATLYYTEKCHLVLYVTCHRVIRNTATCTIRNIATVCYM